MKSGVILKIDCRMTLLNIVRELNGAGFLASISEKMLELTGRDYNAGTTYIMLKRLENSELVSWQLELSNSTLRGRPKKIYQITEAGENSLAGIEN